MEKTLDLNAFGVSELSSVEMREVNGGDNPSLFCRVLDAVSGFIGWLQRVFCRVC